jgi:hypothetical protein
MNKSRINPRTGKYWDNNIFYRRPELGPEVYWNWHYDRVDEINRITRITKIYAVKYDPYTNECTKFELIETLLPRNDPQ